MEIRELWLKHYGKFENHKIVLKPGINIIYGGNEAGKSTIHSFIKAMFYGLNRGRGKAASTDEYQVRQPWNTPGAFDGSMRIEENGEIFRIDRCFDRSVEPLKIVSETCTREIENPEQMMDRWLNQMSENVFANTVFLSQAHGETDDGLASELQRYMVNCENTLDTKLDVSKALQQLRKKKKDLEQQKKKSDEEIEKLIEQKQIRLDEMRKYYEEVKQHIPYAEIPQETEDWEEPESRFSGNRGRTILEILLILSGVFALLGAFFLQQWELKLFLGIFGGLFLLLTIPIHFLLSEEEDEDTEEDAYVRRRERTAKIRREASTSIPESPVLRNCRTTCEELERELEELYQRHADESPEGIEIEALNLAIDRICEVSNGIYEQSGSRLNQYASSILNEITLGKYNKLVLDETMSVRIHTESKVLGLHQVSGGTLQQIYFALRMAAGELLGAGQLPVVLDEAFVLFDDKRLEETLRWLKNSGRQVILFTCHRRERELLSRLS